MTFVSNLTANGNSDHKERIYFHLLIFNDDNLLVDVSNRA